MPVVLRVVPVLMMLAILAVPPMASDGRGIEDESVRVGAYPPDSRSATPGGIFILGTPAADEPRVEIDEASGRFLVHDPDGAVPDRPDGCTSLSVTTVSCPRLGSRVSILLRTGGDELFVGSGVTGAIVGSGQGGPDRVVLARSYPGKLNVSGGRGADVLAGGIRHDRLGGNEGPDRLRGRSGDDDIDGGTGDDAAQGGGGPDRLMMAADDRDESIDCGAGDDLAVIDRDLDPEPKRCERITPRR